MDTSTADEVLIPKPVDFFAPQSCIDATVQVNLVACHALLLGCEVRDALTKTLSVFQNGEACD